MIDRNDGALFASFRLGDDSAFRVGTFQSLRFFYCPKISSDQIPASDDAGIDRDDYAFRKCLPLDVYGANFKNEKRL